MIQMENNNLISIDNGDTNTIDAYIRRKNTSVLVIMFTDIRGFTRLTEEKGDIYTNELRNHHDMILREAIEADDAGLVIKTIGDSFMAVFSEPSTALDRALLIQTRIREFNQKHSEQYEELSVRIGLHMGQVVIENKVHVDVFGRHVNRAARIESLADGGQVLLTYPVFDSAKGWLVDRESLGWVNHGSYYLKGIRDPVEIYEVYDKNTSQPRPPKEGRKKRSIPKWSYLLLFLLIGAVLAYGVLTFQKTEVNLEMAWNGPLYLDDGQRIYLEEKEGSHLRQPKEPLSAEKHLLFYDASKVSRYWAVIDVKRGENIIKPRFNRIHLPGMQVNASYRREKNRQVSREQEYSFTIPGDDFEPKTHKAVIKIDAQVDKIEIDELAVFTIDWFCSLNGEKIGEGQIIDKNAVTNRRVQKDPVVLYADDFHYYFISYTMIRDAIQFELKSQFIRYKE